MVKTYLYIPDELNDELNAMASLYKQSKAAVLRSALKKGVIQMKKKKPSKVESMDPGLEVFMKLADIGEKYLVKGPKDLAKNHDKYLWDTYEI